VQVKVERTVNFCPLFAVSPPVSSYKLLDVFRWIGTLSLNEKLWSEFLVRICRMKLSSKEVWMLSKPYHRGLVPTWY